MSRKTQPSNRTIKNAFDSAEQQSLHALMLKNYGLILLARLEAAEAESKRYNDALTVAILAKQDAELLASHAHQKTYKDALIENTTAESRIAELEAKLEAAATTQRVCDVIEWLGTQCANSQAVKALIKALEDKS